MSSLYATMHVKIVGTLQVYSRLQLLLGQFFVQHYNIIFHSFILTDVEIDYHNRLPRHRKYNMAVSYNIYVLLFLGIVIQNIIAFIYKYIKYKPIKL